MGYAPMAHYLKKEKAVEGVVQRRCLTIYGADAIEKMKVLERYGWIIDIPSTNSGHDKALRNGSIEVLLFVRPDQVITSNVFPQDNDLVETPESEDVIMDLARILTLEKVDHGLSRTWS
ncbi:MAG: hypothetical protein B7X39_03310 [Lysobacterales bacterium 14-68-21]|jgi:hypothetical protein|nr:MAG: hypothetical protein B7X45_04940 [Xanthomonadales bacterium 15-68-25]OZB68211.1 MAG: hypothetical protein B7X39_03310 [Xanthomonadales bacterium 14-68-21]